jgi:hypothetical protein
MCDVMSRQLLEKGILMCVIVSSELVFHIFDVDM